MHPNHLVNKCRNDLQGEYIQKFCWYSDTQCTCKSHGLWFAGLACLWQIKLTFGICDGSGCIIESLLFSLIPLDHWPWRHGKKYLVLKYETFLIYFFENLCQKICDNRKNTCIQLDNMEFLFSVDVIYPSKNRFPQDNFWKAPAWIV